MKNRLLQWKACTNTRDLGGLPLMGGGKTQLGRFVRSDHPKKLDAGGWQALLSHGVGTVVTLFSEGAARDDFDSRSWPSEIVHFEIAIEDFGEGDFLEKWGKPGWLGTPFYYPEALKRWPRRHAAVMRILANAPYGGVFFHCQRGCDRTGIIALLLLSLSGVQGRAIIDDYLISVENMPPNEQSDLAALVERKGRTVVEGLEQVLADLDPRRYLKGGGLDDATLDRLKNRLVGAD